MKKIITTLLIIPMLLGNISISEAKTINLNTILTGLNAITTGFDVFQGLSRDDRYDPFIWYAVEKLDAQAPALAPADSSLGSIGQLSYESLMSVVESTFKFLRKPDGKSFKVEYNVFDGKVTYEHFSNPKTMYAVNPSATNVYKFYKFKPSVLEKSNFGNEKIYVSGIANGYADTNKGFIKISDLTSNAPIAVKSVALSNSSITLKNIRSFKLTATINPSNATNKNVTWKSSNTKVVTVDTNGNVKAVGPGTATVTVTSNNGKTATCKFTVSNPVSTTEVKSVTINKPSTTIIKGRTEKLTATINPSNATNKNVTWKSSNTKVATVDTNGNVKAVGPGTATITVTSNNGKTATCRVTVKNPYATRTVKFTVKIPTSFKQKHYVEVLDGNNNVLYKSSQKTGSSSYSFTYQLDNSSSSYTRKIRVRTVSGNKIYNSNSFKINSSTLKKDVTATFPAATSNALGSKLAQITQK